jgi:hypothetical protein
MSQVIASCEDSDDNGQRPNTASVPSPPLSRKRPRDKKGSRNGPKNKTATGSIDFVVNLERADEVEVSTQKKRRGVVRSKPSAKNDTAGNCAQILKRVEATEKEVGSEDSEQTRRDDDSTNKHSKKLSTSKTPSSASGRQRRVSVWEGRLSELADYHKIHGHCNVPHNSENSKLGKWVGTQRSHYFLQLEGKTSPMTTLRIQDLESLGFEWDSRGAAWEDRLSELDDYRKIHGHWNVPRICNEYPKLAQWAATQRKQYRLHLKGKTSHMTPFRIQELESIGFEWYGHSAVWEDRRSELADYCKQHGHCNVPQRCSEKMQLGYWVRSQRRNYKLQLEGRASSMTPSRILALESLGFEWGPIIDWRKGVGQKQSFDDDGRRVRKTSANSSQAANSQLETEPPNTILRATGYH